MSSATESDPLLGQLSVGQPGVNAPHTAHGVDSHGMRKVAVGPLEISSSNRRSILAGVFFGQFLSALNMTMVPTLIPSISSQFNQAHQASWLGTAYLLAACTFMPLYGRLCDVLGRRAATQMALVLTGLGVLACGCSNSMETLIVARFLGGMGGGGLFTTGGVVMSDMYSLRSRGLAQGVASVFSGMGLGMGGPFGGLISDRFGWRCAFLVQLPFFVLSLVLLTCNLNYVIPGQGKSPKEILKRIDHGGSVTLLATIASILVFSSTRYNEGRDWADPTVYIPLVLAVVFFISFMTFELFIAPEPVLPPAMLTQKIPVLVAISNFLVSMCNFSITFFFPMWFQIVAQTSVSISGLHLMPNSLSMSLGSLFAGWMMHRTGHYKLLNLTFGILPSIGTALIMQITEQSGWWQKWFSVVPLGFGNAVVQQTTLIALLSHLPNSAVAMGMGFGLLFRGLGQVSGVAISSAIYQSALLRELRARITGPGSAEIIDKVRHSTSLVATLPPALQRAVRDAYATSLHAVFVFATISTFLAYLARLPIPDRKLEHHSSSRQADVEVTPEQTRV